MKCCTDLSWKGGGSAVDQVHESTSDVGNTTEIVDGASSEQRTLIGLNVGLYCEAQTTHSAAPAAAAVTFYNCNESHACESNIGSAIVKGIDPVAVRCAYTDHRDDVCAAYGTGLQSPNPPPPPPKRASAGRSMDVAASSDLREDND